MPIAADYPFMDVLWSMIIFFCWVAWIWILILCFSDLFRRHISGWAKAAWIVFLIILPFLGVLIYLIAEHQGMADRNIKQAQAQQQQFDQYVKSVAGGSADEIAKAKQLLDSGAITQAEFDALKAKALG
jgi:general stress protein CsbA